MKCLAFHSMLLHSPSKAKAISLQAALFVPTTL